MNNLIFFVFLKNFSVSGLSPFAGECDVETMGNVTVGKYDFNDEAFDNVSADCIDFITKCLVKEHDNRLTAKDALRHKWVKRKPQYTPNNAKTSSPLSFKAVYPDKVRIKFCQLLFETCSLSSLMKLNEAMLQVNDGCFTSTRQKHEIGTKFSFQRNSINDSFHFIVARFFFSDEKILSDFPFFLSRRTTL